jgi:1-acyl-sn-glycerol-3-phosphate acyltransferase
MASAFVQEIQDRVERLEIPFNREGFDKYGISKKHLVVFFTALGWMYRNYFRVKVYGIEHVPPHRRGMLIGNHSGGYAIDGAMVLASMLLDMEPPRLAQGMAEKFLNALPVASLWTSRVGQLTGLPEHAIRLLEDDRLLMVFPEGARGTAKLYKDRYSLVDFGTGFMRLALQTKTPIIPLAFIGGGDALPTVMNLYSVGKLLGAPYIPVTPYLLPLPLPRPCAIHYGEPMHFEGTGNEDDEHIDALVHQVKERVRALMEKGRAMHESGADREGAAS